MKTEAGKLVQLLRLLLTVLPMFLLVPTSGCGGNSQQDLMMRAAQRPRDESEVDEESDVEPTPPPANVAANSPAEQPAASPAPGAANGSANNSPANNSSANGASGASATGTIASSATAPVSGVKPGVGEVATPGVGDGLLAPISERQPSAPLTDFQRRKMAADNIKKIANGLTVYFERKGSLPARGMKSKSGLITLSWRVELLPYLGYDELYKQFDTSQPWDSPKNMALLERIPDCYVSPERFDTNTNYLGVQGASYLFQDKPVPARSIEDGLENTLAILEVNNELAVPWTSPSDFEVEVGRAAEFIGDLRPEGTYAIWGNGWTTLLKKGVSSGQLHNAFTFESGDGLVASDIHNSLMIRDSDGPPSQGPPSQGPASQGPASNAMASVSGQPNAANAPRPMVNRDTDPADVRPNGLNGGESLPKLEMPNRAAKAAAIERVEGLFDSKIRGVTNREQLKQLSTEMLESARQMREDPAGAFALQQAAIDLASKSGGLDVLAKAVDDHVSMFDVDSIETNLTSLKAFGEQNGGPLAETVSSREFLGRALPVIFGAILNDSYEVPQDVVQFAILYESRSGNREFIPDLNRLRQQLTSTRNFFRQTAAALSDLRSNPNDPAANFTVGRYMAFIKGDWERGLQLLALSENERLAQMAKADLDTAGNSPDRMLATADAWWDLGEETKNDLFKGACRERAGYWYDLAMASLPESLSKLHAKARLEESWRSVSGSPLASIRRLATDLGIDIEQELASRKNPMLKQKVQAESYK